MTTAKTEVGEVDRQGDQENEGERGDHESARGEGSGAVAVGQQAAQRGGEQQPDGQRDHVDAGPERCLLEAVAVQGQPDALQPDHQHEHEAAPAHRGQEAGHVAGREGADPEELEAEHRVGHLGLDDPEHHQDGDAAEDLRQHDRARPPHGVAAIGQQAVGDADQDQDQTTAKVELPSQSILAGTRAHCGRPASRRRRACPESRPVRTPGRRGATRPGPAGRPGRARRRSRRWPWCC